MTQSENAFHSYQELGRVGISGKNHPSSKSVKQLSLSGELIKIWDSMMTVEKVLGISQTSISDCCLEKKYKKSAGGFKWKFNE